VNRFKQKIIDYDDTIAMGNVQPSIASIAFNHKTRLTDSIFAFAKESNQIENIYDFNKHMLAEERLIQLLELEEITVADLCTFNDGHGRLRVNGECVRVGNHFPPKGGQNILYAVENILDMVNGLSDPYAVHHTFETIHPFTDGNGRTGRAIWLWQMVNKGTYNIENLFLQEWYYQSLDKGRA